MTLQLDGKEAREYCHWHIEHHSIYYCKPGTFLPGKAPGTRYQRQWYLRRSLYDPTFFKSLGVLFWERFEGEDFQICACEDAGIPVALAVQSVKPVNVFTIKKKRKEYGLKNMTEGRITDAPILLVDDLAGSQNTLKRAEALLASKNLPLFDNYFTVVDKNVNCHPENYLSRKLQSIFRADEFCKSREEYIEKYNKEPDFGNWY